jgi:D-glycero-alpha-D-manno-heptose-7-phosphate kinase
MRAYRIAREVLGNPVGKQDEFAAAFGGLNYIEFHRDGSVNVEPIMLPPELFRELQANLMLFFTGAAHNSWDILKTQETATKKTSCMAVEALHEIRELAGTMRNVLMQGELEHFGRLLHKAWEAKKLVSSRISTSHIDDLYAMARQAGAVGGKITGAGGGGFMLLYVPAVHQESVRQAFTARGLREMIFGFDRDGAQVIINDPFLDSDKDSGTRWDFVPLTANRAKT